jgi:Mitotic checkpoint protein.
MVLQHECNKSKLVCFRDAVHSQLVLEKEVTDLRSQKARFEEQEQKLVQLEASHRHLESMQEHWCQVVRDYCLGLSQEKAIVGPELLRMKIETLQQNELLLAADKGRLDSRSVDTWLANLQLFYWLVSYLMIWLQL